jgi:O-antigen ligase
MSARFGFPVLLAFVVVDYLRPQDWIGPLEEQPIALIAAIPLALCLLGTLQRNTVRDPVAIAMASIVLFSAAWVPFATNNFWAFQAFKFLIVSWIMMLAVATFVDRPARLRVLLAVLLAIFSIEAISALRSGGHGNNTYFGDENDLALGLNIALPFAVLGIGSARGLAARLALLAASALLIAGVVASSSRGGLVGLAAAAGAIALVSRRRLVVLFGLLAAVAALAWLAPAAYWADMGTMFDPADATRGERVHQWNDARRIWRDNPWLGVGPGNVPWVMAAYETFDDLAARSMAGRAVHSVYFTVLPEYGLFGTSLFVLLLGATAAHCAAVIRRRSEPASDADPWARAILASAATCLAGGAFISVLLFPHLYYLAGLSMAVRSIGLRATDRAPSERGAAWATPLPPLFSRGAAALSGPKRFGVGPLRGL